MSDYPERDHGLGDHGEPTGRPVAKLLSPETLAKIRSENGCPVCGCFDLLQIEVPVKCDKVVGEQGIGRYIGCPACPWASPMVIIGNQVRSE